MKLKVGITTLAIVALAVLGVFAVAQIPGSEAEAQSDHPHREAFNWDDPGITAKKIDQHGQLVNVDTANDSTGGTRYIYIDQPFETDTSVNWEWDDTHQPTCGNNSSTGMMSTSKMLEDFGVATYGDGVVRGTFSAPKKDQYTWKYRPNSTSGGVKTWKIFAGWRMVHDHGNGGHCSYYLLATVLYVETSDNLARRPTATPSPTHPPEPTVAPTATAEPEPQPDYGQPCPNSRHKQGHWHGKKGDLGPFDPVVHAHEGGTYSGTYGCFSNRSRRDHGVNFEGVKWTRAAPNPDHTH